MDVLDFLSIYAAIVSTLVAIPTITQLYRNYFNPIRFICRSYSGYDVKKDEEPIVLHLFDITIANNTKEDLYLSKASFELKNPKENMGLLSGNFMINVDFGNKLSPGQTMREYGKLFDDLKNLEPTESKLKTLKQFDSFRVIIESSLGKTYKSQWYKHNIIVNNDSVKWQRLENLDEYNALLGNQLS